MKALSPRGVRMYCRKAVTNADKETWKKRMDVAKSKGLSPKKIPPDFISLNNWHINSPWCRTDPFIVQNLLQLCSSINTKFDKSHHPHTHHVQRELSEREQKETARVTRRFACMQCMMRETMSEKPRSEEPSPEGAVWEENAGLRSKALADSFDFWPFLKNSQ